MTSETKREPQFATELERQLYEALAGLVEIERFVCLAAGQPAGRALVIGDAFAAARAALTAADGGER
jgi:hypothetical protein